MVETERLTEDQIDEMVREYMALPVAEPDPATHAERVEYSKELDVFVLHLKNGIREFVARERLQGLQNVPEIELLDFHLESNGYAIWWDTLDLGFTVQGLLAHRYGNRQWMAELGRRGGKKTSAIKGQKSRVNGAKGGRPKRVAAA